jgi:beta-glucosidase
MTFIPQLLSQLALEEKVSLLSGLNYWYLKGVDRLGIPSIMITDGPHGLRKQEGDPTRGGLSDTIPATCFPTASALAATWNRDLLFKIGKALGEECRQEKVAVLLGPGANIKRSPLCGRNFEYFSEDPFLSGQMAKSLIQGVQSQGIGTSLKHYAANNQEYRRMTIDAIVDERALREIYLAGFEIAVKEAQPWTVMGAYNKINGIYACEHPDLLTNILKDEWGHQGLVMTDWGAMNEPVDALAAGLELEMPGTNSGNETLIIKAIEAGKLDEGVLDAGVERILSLIFKAKKTLEMDFSYDRDAHHELARKVAGEGVVLLKNVGNLLPLDPGENLALIGDMAIHPRFQGAGSSLVNPTQLENIYEEVQKISTFQELSYAPGYPENGLKADRSLIDDAVRVAQEADVAVICVGLPDNFETEGLDRDHLELPESHDALIRAILEVQKNVVLILNNGSPVEMPWIDQIPAVLEGYLGGQAGAGALADILFGITNPSGKLAETFPIKLEDNPSYPYFPGGPKIVEYRESLYVGYRYYDTVNKDVLFPFGHGLSYAEFKYSDLEFNQTNLTDQEHLQVSLKVKNLGDVRAKEVVQVYVSPVSSDVFRPKQELKGFEKITLEPGEVKEVNFSFNDRAFAYYNTGTKDWQVESGEYQILVGSSSRDIRLEGSVYITSTQKDVMIPDRDRLPAYQNFQVDGLISKEDFEKLIGRKVPNNLISARDPYTIKTPLADMGSNPFGWILIKIVDRQLKKMTRDDPDGPTALMMRSMVKTMPLRTMLLMGGARISREILDGLLLIMNGYIYKGLILLIRTIRTR